MAIPLAAEVRTGEGSSAPKNCDGVTGEPGDPFCCGIARRYPNIIRFGWLWEWLVLRVRHPRIDEANVGVIGLDQARGVVQSASFVEEQGKMSSLDSIDDTEFFGPNTPNPSQDEGSNIDGDRRLRFAIICAVVIVEILVNS
uniref:Uncharacterized protein n=1 Tax=Romanomermis culicivorax TaxID=13658 RepID=A0A915JM96_ROMCU